MAIVYAYRKDYENEDLIVNTYFPINIDSKTRLRIKIEATELERKMMGE